MAKIKIIGKRKCWRNSLKDVNDFLKCIIALRGGKPFIPKGVFRFKTFEEAQEWTIKTVVKNIQDHQQ